MASSYADVFKPRAPQPRWSKPKTHPWLSKLHAEFWGKSIDIDQGKLERRQSLGQADQLNILPDNFVLDLGINDVMSSRIWVRREYRLLYDGCDEHCKNVIKYGPLAPAAVITGHPGIGKCFSSQTFSFSNTIL